MSFGELRHGYGKQALIYRGLLNLVSTFVAFREAVSRRPAGGQLSTDGWRCKATFNLTSTHFRRDARQQLLRKFQHPAVAAAVETPPANLRQEHLK